MSETRGVLNHNPGNLRRSPDKWQGLAKEQDDAEFFQFQSAVWGIRALARTLITYQDRHGLKDIDGIIRRWAPPTENDTESYIRSVCKKTKIGRHALIDVHRYEDLKPLVTAVIAHENRNYAYPDSVVDKALVLAGVESPQPKSLQKSRTVKGAQVAAAGTGLGLIAELVRNLEPALPLLTTALEFAPWVVGGIVLISIAWILWARLDDRRRGLR